MSRIRYVAGLAAATCSALAGVALGAPSITVQAQSVSSPDQNNVSVAPAVPLAGVPAASGSLADLVAAKPLPAELDRETECLAASVYFEAKSEPLEGQLAVAEVILNRASSGRFPASICGVVLQPSQFSFVRGRGFPPINKASAHWKRAVAIARIAIEDGWDSVASNALYFHARRVSPGWRKARVATVGNHIFYR